ncbi:hypothetical protein JCM19240_1899 [Vibrio maritimus]|uniref:Uncharacterized protein n=1 Tax=Vibrio maritimus TaxID=990268 RepID=A0A090T917_9VIBR|nr:hypothetical protein JCM19240_1899 [Vibrio maritimus]
MLLEGIETLLVLAQEKTMGRTGSVSISASLRSASALPI